MWFVAVRCGEVWHAKSEREVMVDRLELLEGLVALALRWSDTDDVESDLEVGGVSYL